ncbi:MAG: tRNA (N6-isopentenyl adenosine(37)-C2)-methylthiotransferase MiaB [Planctomycetota bacterium]
MKNVYIETFGCQMNLADTETVLARLSDAGYQRCHESEQADLILYNTCSVRDNAEAKVRGRLDNLKWAKRERPALRIGIMGCMAQRLREQLLEQHPHVDLVVGTDQFVHIPALLEQLEQQGQLVATDFGDFEDRNWHAHRTEGINAWVPVMRGCNYNCTYCIVPKTRGAEKSRRPELIEEEVRELVDQGFVQVTLLGQTIDAYGKTLGDGSDLAGLLRRLHAIEGLERIRFVTSHPKDITDRLLQTIAELPKVAKHLHVPAQSGSDRILRLMGRRYGRDDYLRFVERARRIVPGVELLSDFIVGFPRESDEDFQQTVSLMREVRFDGAFVFMYSPRPGTGAARLPDEIPDTIKRARCNELLGLQLQQQEAQHQELIGQELEILIEGPTRKDPERLLGRSIGNRMVVVPRAGNEHLLGQLATARIERATNLTLFGELVACPSRTAG